jgi:serine/threonine protein kinase
VNGWVVNDLLGPCNSRHLARFFTHFTHFTHLLHLLHLLHSTLLPSKHHRSRFYTAELVSALAHLHSQRMVHRDLKPANVMIDVLGHVRLVDFGLCKQHVSSRAGARTFVGTQCYMAPEIICMSNRFAFLADPNSDFTGGRTGGYGAACDW